MAGNFLGKLWDTGEYARENTRKNSKQKNPLWVVYLMYFFILVGSVSIILFLLYASLFSRKLADDENIEKIYNHNRATHTLEAAQLDMIRYFENYRIAYEGAVLAFLLIISSCLIYNIFNKKK